MQDYKVKSLKANSAGIANMVIDEMIPYVDYLGVSSSGGGTGSTGGVNLSNYYTKTEVDTKIGDINTILDNINGEVI